MDKTGREHRTGPSTGQFPYGLLFIAVLGVLGIGGVWFLAAQVACGCATPADLVVVNQSTHEAVIEWQHPGLLGTPLFRTGGRETAPAGQSTGLAVDTGEVRAVVSVGETRQAVALVVADRHTPSAWVLIDPAGQVTAGTGDAPAEAPDGAGSPSR